MRITSELEGRQIVVRIENIEKSDITMRVTHVKYIIKALRDQNPDVFYNALTDFVTDEELENALKWVNNKIRGT